MRVLILPAIFALAVAAPSGELKEAAPLAVLPVVTPTIDPGDIQAAAINAQVAAEDQARAAVDKVVEENNEKVIESESLVKEKTEETFWAGEEKKWQALDAVQTAAAKIDGAVASNADALARSAIGGVILPTYVAPSLVPAPLVRTPIVPGTPINAGLPLYGPPIISPISPIVYTPGIKKEGEKELVKTAEPEKDKQVLHPLYPGLISAPVITPISPIAYIPDTKKDYEKEKQILKIAELNKDKQQVLQTIYQAQIISPTFDLFYNPNIIRKEETGVQKEKELVKIADTEKDRQVVFYEARLVTGPITSNVAPIFYSPGILVKQEKVSKHSEIEKNAQFKKEENILEEKKEDKLSSLEKADKDKLEKPLVASILPLPIVSSQWPLSPVAPVYVPQPILTPVIAKW